MLLPTIKRHESVRAAVRRRLGLTTLSRRDGKLAVRVAERILER